MGEVVMGAHLNENGLFQSDKYPTCPAGKVPLSTKDPMARDLLWLYAQRRRAVDAEFADDLETALKRDGFKPVDNALHKAWSACVGRAKYDKSAWRALEPVAEDADRCGDPKVVLPALERIAALLVAQDGLLDPAVVFMAAGRWR